MARKGLAHIVLALCVFMIPLQWLWAAFLAAVVHEICHLMMVRSLGGEVISFSLGIGGAQMEVRGLSAWKESMCALAGPIGGLCLLSVSRWFPRIAICGTIQSVFNLFPIYPLDGGRALQCWIMSIGGEASAYRWCMRVERAFLAVVCCAASYRLLVLGLGGVPLVALAVIIMRWLRGKIPCKPGTYSLQ